MKKNLLFLTHRIPYPPNKGDKIRSFNLLKHLAEDYHVHLGTFIDDSDDWQYTDNVQEMCRETCFVRLNSIKSRLKSLSGLFTGEALTLPYYRSHRLQSWVDNLLDTGAIDHILVFSSAMAQYVLSHFGGNIQGVLDFVDVDSDKWRQYSLTKRWPIKALYHRESVRLLQFERVAAERFQASIFISHQEAELFKRLAPTATARVSYIENGVDTEYFSPERPYPNPYNTKNRVLVFTGAMDYWANVHGVTWFAQDIFPMVQARVTDAIFYIVGSRPVDAVRKLAGLNGVVVTGAVRDTRPYLAHAHAMVAPLRIARGVQNKVLEAMAMGKPVIATTEAMAGIKVCTELKIKTYSKPSTMAEWAIEVLENDAYQKSLGIRGRQFVLEHYNWTNNLRRLKHLLEGCKENSKHDPGHGEYSQH